MVRPNGKYPKVDRTSLEILLHNCCQLLPHCANTSGGGDLNNGALLTSNGQLQKFASRTDSHPRSRNGVLVGSYLVRSGEKSANEMARSSKALGANPCSTVIRSA
jgi:hypothetical protein